MNNLRKTALFILFVLSYFISYPQSPVSGGLQNNKTLILTPSPEDNKRLEGKNPFEVDFLGLKENSISFEFSPKLPKEWNWVALFNVSLKGKTINTFYYDSWVATDQSRIITNGRRRNFDVDITKQIKSNAYHIAFQRKQVAENEVFILIVSPAKQKVIVEIDKEQFGVSRRLMYDMEANEAKFVHIVIPPKEYTVVTWQKENTPAQKILLSKGWKFHKGDVRGAEAENFDDARWEDVNIPHTWNASDLFDYRNFKDSIDITEMIWRGVGWYRKQFIAQESWKGKYTKVNFLGANQVAEVFINGKFVGKHVGGYTDFHYDISPYLEYGKPNTLAVKVDNRFDYDIPPHTADYNMLGGIYREVEILSLNPVFISKVHITTPAVNIDSARVEVSAILNNKLQVDKSVTLLTNLINPYNEIIQSKIQTVRVKAGVKASFQTVFEKVEKPLLWSPDYPNLYRISTTLYEPSGTLQTKGAALDQRFDNMGFRFYSFDANKGLNFNGKALKMKGVNVHQDYMHKGWAVDKKQKREDFVHIKKMGANYVRLSHYPHHPYVLDLCDSLGLMVWSEIPVVNTVGKEKFIENAVKMMEEMITRDINHPSILIWGVGNEYYRNFFNKEDAEYALKSTDAVAKKVKELDPYRPTIQAQNDLVDDRIMRLTDLQGRNRYMGWYEKTYDDFEHEMKKDHEKYPDWKMIVSEYGAEGKYGYHVNNPTLFDHSETYQINLHKAYWKVIRDNDFIIGGTIWNMFDFASWAKIGNIPHINQKGMMTYDRKPKSVYYYYQSQWTEEPMVYIYSHTHVHRSGNPNEKQDIEVFSNCDEVELFLNGISQGKQAKSYGYIWKVTYNQGVNDVKAIGHKQGETVRTNMQIIFHPSTDPVKQQIVKPKGDG
ncbi:MAG: glycoside hydrolase family 2 protein [Bacteroidota bacterium]